MALCLALFAVAGAHAQGTVRRGVIDGVVIDSMLAPVIGAVVSVDGTDVRVATGVNGGFRIVALPAGDFLITARKIGYAPVSTLITLNSADTVRVSMTLVPNVRTLDSVLVTAAVPTARLSEFEQRRQLGEGQFLTGEDIDRRNVVYVTDLIAPLKGIRMHKGIALNGRTGAIRDCPLQVFIDGVMQISSGLEDGALSPKDVRGIEVYVGVASIPLRYKTVGNGGACGVILLWTKASGA